MGFDTLIDDFYETDIMNHCEFLKYLLTLGKDDSRLLVCTLERMASEDPPKKISPFYTNHQTLTKNPYHIVKVYSSLKDLEGNTLNIYECAYLECVYDEETWWIPYMAVATFLLQITLIIIVMMQYLEMGFDQISWHIRMWIITVGTSYFFAVDCYNEFMETQTFINAFQSCGRTDMTFNKWMIMDRITNQLFGAIIPFFNFYFLLLSDSETDAILNSVGLFFLMELDDMVNQSWDDDRVWDELVINMHDFIMEDMDPKAVTITKDGPGIYKDGDKLYVSLHKKHVARKRRSKLSTSTSSIRTPLLEEVKNGCESPTPGEKGIDAKYTATVYRRMNATEYEKTRYYIGGKCADDFYESLQSFGCLRTFKDIHD